MTLLIAGVALWWAAHLFKRLAPGARASLGECRLSGDGSRDHLKRCVDGAGLSRC